MADEIKVSDLPAATTSGEADEVVINQSGITKRMPLSILADSVSTPHQYLVVANIAARDAITGDDLANGLLVFVSSNRTTYQYIDDWVIFDDTNAFAPPTFDNFQIEGQGTRLGIGASITAGSKTFQWSTSNPDNIVADSITITDVTTSTVLTTGQANDGDYIYNLISPITNNDTATHTWRITGTDTLGNTFSADFTVTWIAVSTETYYVSPSGSDSNPGTSLLPWLTLAYAESQAQAGDTVIVRAGDYTGFQVTKSGVSGGPVTFQGETGAIITTPVIVGGIRFGVTSVGFEYRTFDNLDVDASSDSNQWNAGYRMSGFSGIWVRNNEIKNCRVEMKIGSSATGDQFCIRTSWWDHGLVHNNRLIGSWDTPNYFANSARDCTFSLNEVSDCYGNGPHNNGDESAGLPGVCYRLTFSNNIIYNCCLGGGGQALSFDGCQDSVVENNLVYNCHARCLAMFSVNSREGSTDNLVVNNTFILAVDGSVNVRLARYCERITLFNNIILNVNSDGIAYRFNDDALSELVCDYNALSAASSISIENVDGDSINYTLDQWQFSERDVHSIVTTLTTIYGSANPSSFFPIPAAPVIDAGQDTLNSFSAPTTDLSGVARPSGDNDIGCYEFIAGLPYVTAVTPLATTTGVLSGICTMTTSVNVTQASVEFSLVASDDTVIAGTIGVVGAVITFTPTDPTDLQPATIYTATLTDAATAGGLHIPGAIVWSFTTEDAPSIGPFSLFDQTLPGSPDFGDPTPIEAGMRFRSSVSGRAVGVRFYKSVANTNTHKGRLYSNTGTLLGSCTFSAESTSGWQEQAFENAVSITADVTYVVSYTDPAGHYAADTNYFSEAVTRGFLTGVADGPSSQNGVFQTFGGFPDTSGSGTNYWVDVLLGLVVPYNGETGVSLDSTPSCRFNVPVQSGTISFVLTDGADADVPGTLSYNSSTRVATFTPDNPLEEGETYTATISEATITGGVFTMPEPTTWSFTTLVLPTTVSVVSTVPTDGATDFSIGDAVEATFDQDVDPDSIVFVLENGEGTITGTDSYNSGTFTYTFTPDNPLTAEDTYTATISAADAAIGSATLAAPVEWTFTTTQSLNTFFGEQIPGTVDSADGGAYTMGTMIMFRSSAQIVGIRFYKATTNTGTHTGKLWDSVGIELATVTFSSESASGWQEATFSSPITITKFTQYWVTVTMPAGHYSVDNDYWDSQRATSGPIYIPSARATERPSGFFVGSTPTFPNVLTTASYWVDVLAEATSTPPQSLISDTQAFSGDDNGSAYTLGFKFSVDTAGQAVGVRFWRTASETGTHTIKLWSEAGTELATGTSSGEYGAGWQYANFDTPVALTAGVTYIASFLSNRYNGLASGYFNSPVTRGHITAPADATLFKAGNAFPDQISLSTFSQGVDVLFVPD